MDWITLGTSAAAFVISSVCAALGYRRTHGTIPRELHTHDSAIASLRKQNATLMARLRKLEAAIPTVTGDAHGA
jgi:hypothetical protein